MVDADMKSEGLEPPGDGVRALKEKGYDWLRKW